MTTKEEVYKLYTDYVQAYREWSRRVGLKERDFSTEMSRVATIFYDYDGGELCEDMETWMYNFIGELERIASQYGVLISREINGKHVLLKAALSVKGYENHTHGLGSLGIQMFSGISEDDEDFKQVILRHLGKSSLDEVTSDDWSNIAQSFRNGLHYVDYMLENKLSEVDFVMNNIEHKINTEALTKCTEYMRPIMRVYYDNADKLYHKLIELDPQNDYIRKLHETTFVEGFDTFYKYMVEQDRKIHGVLKIINGLKNNIALAEHYGCE